MSRRAQVVLVVLGVVVLVGVAGVVGFATGDGGGDDAEPAATAPSTTPATSTPADPAASPGRPAPPPATLPSKPEAPRPAPPPSRDDPPPAPAPPGGAPVVRVTGPRVLRVAADGRVTPRARCSGATRCQGALRMSVPRSELDGVAGLDTTIASGDVAIRRGGSAAVPLRLSAGARAALTDGMLPATATAITRQPGGGTVTRTVRVVLRR